MTNSELLDEILYECHQKGIVHEVMEKVKQMLDKNPLLDKVDAYQIVYQQIINDNSN